MKALTKVTRSVKPAEVEKKWHLIDAEGLVLGRLAVIIANTLRGKHKPTFTPHIDCGDHVIIVNVDKMVLTGKKLEQKFYRHHTGYVGGLKEINYKTLMAKNPERAMTAAVKGMIPDTVIGRQALTRLRVYKGAAHKHEAQKPEEFQL